MYINKDTLSIIIPAYNEENNIKKILETLENQSIYGFEVIVVDDGSYDNTAKIVKNYTPKRYSLILLEQENKGAAVARKIAINKSISRFIAVIDCDDGIDSDTLEKALVPVLNNNNIDISLFNLKYIDNINSQKSSLFKYYTSKKFLKGTDVFENCIKDWGVHGFGIYKKELILKAYKLYHELNPSDTNFLNNDEIISRISFDISNEIAITCGNYYFVNNNNSTTRRVNNKYFNVIHNSFILLTYIKDKREKKETLKISKDINSLIISTIWGVTLRYIRWNKYLSKEEKLQWKLVIKDSANKISKSKVNRNLKENIKLLFINYLI
ncbi:glycosyltransferase family 2 protein [Proteus mirabilis]|uniref:glycosyltransferase family 2 protein n=1 Tax=Proteus mirabilis TaxID=584 RepID=UPI001626E65A|nr:glycosyltransferase family 2 protein [Proteus mirabilis]MBB6663354.1 glycosyltransferase family 2 protein [Proteus mirabilis]MBB6706782.1 glycosyltransferase family 2 protein [Proteus mirabilis]MBB6728896.1 glycosyltransferase family 2 protein [Proteus mirabilis]MBS3845417.1 glycosyltransferase family 2 protein [Proteus mirabilis]